MINKLILKNISKALEIYEQIFLIKTGWDCSFKFYEHFCQSQALLHSPKKILILSPVPLPPCGNPNVTCQDIGEEDARIFMQLYHTYEFSDRFQVISQEDIHGGLFDFLATGLLNQEEVFEALLS